MNFLKKFFEKFIGKNKMIPSPFQTDTPQAKVIEENNKVEKIKSILEKSDEEIITELNMIVPGIFSQAKTPQAKKMIIQIYKKMIEDGIDVKNEKEVEKWMKKNQDLFAGNEPKVETYRRDKPKVGRNDPCPCGSGRKYKKCCGA